MPQPKPIYAIEPADPRWKDLYQIGGIANIIVALTTIFAIIAFFIWPYEPGAAPVADIFATLQEDRLGGMIALDLIFIVVNLILVLPVLALYVALRRVNESYALIALAVGFMGIVALIPARPIAEIVALGDQYTAATTDSVRNQYLAAGEALLTLFNGTAWIVNIVLVSVSSLISCLLMLRSTIFSRTIAYFGIVINILVLLFFVPAAGTILLFLGTIGSVVFQFVIGLRLVSLARRLRSA